MFLLKSKIVLLTVLICLIGIMGNLSSVAVESGQKAGDRKVITVKGFDYTFCWCPAGTFMMGSPESEEGRADNEMQHEVTLSRGFWLLETEVTQEMWVSVMGNNPSYYKGRKVPVTEVSWNDCQEFITKLNAETGQKFSLPTEAQWEYACRAGTTGKYGGTGNIDDMRNNSKIIAEVKTKQPNAWGLYDMHGNVWEWCSDWHGKYFEPNLFGEYSPALATDPTGPTSGSSRVLRGGCWNDGAGFCRSASRSFHSPVIRSGLLGFRFLLSSEE